MNLSKLDEHFKRGHIHRVGQHSQFGSPKHFERKCYRAMGGCMKSHCACCPLCGKDTRNGSDTKGKLLNCKGAVC